MQIEAIYQIYKNHPVISTDNRKVAPGSIFVALRGEKFDGNSFARSALENGAAYAIIDNKDFFVDERTILVEDGLHTLQQLANRHRKTFNIPFIAICGSNGKTTTKELTFAVLSSTYKTFATKGNLNNHIGVPLTLLSIPSDTEMAIIEIGANHLHETYDLCKIAEPNFGLVTNNGKDHLEGFGSIENVISANSELFDWLRKIKGKAFVAGEDHTLITNSSGIDRWTYGRGKEHNFSFDPIVNEKFAAIRVAPNGPEIRSQLFGGFNIDNIVAAAAIGTYFNVPADAIATAIANYQPGLNRSQILVSKGTTYYLDCYNANPSSMQLAIESFYQSASHPKGLILADMLELGEYSLREHQEIVDQIKKLNLDKIILIGKFFGETKGDLNCHYFATTNEASAWFRDQKFEGWSFLLKGSRGYALERLIDF